MVPLGLYNQKQVTESSRPGEQRPDPRYHERHSPHLTRESARGPWGWALGAPCTCHPRGRSHAQTRWFKASVTAHGLGRLGVLLNEARLGPARPASPPWSGDSCSLLPRGGTWACSSEEAGVQALGGLGSEPAQRHLHCILLIKASHKATQIQGQTVSTS